MASLARLIVSKNVLKGPARLNSPTALKQLVFVKSNPKQMNSVTCCQNQQLFLDLINPSLTCNTKEDTATLLFCLQIATSRVVFLSMQFGKHLKKIMAPSESRHQNGNILGNSDTGSIDRRTNQRYPKGKEGSQIFNNLSHEEES